MSGDQLHFGLYDGSEPSFLNSADEFADITTFLDDKEIQYDLFDNLPTDSGFSTNSSESGNHSPNGSSNDESQKFSGSLPFNSDINDFESLFNDQYLNYTFSHQSPLESHEPRARLRACSDDLAANRVRHEKNSHIETQMAQTHEPFHMSEFEQIDKLNKTRSQTLPFPYVSQITQNNEETIFYQRDNGPGMQPLEEHRQHKFDSVSSQQTPMGRQQKIEGSSVNSAPKIVYIVPTPTKSVERDNPNFRQPSFISFSANGSSFSQAKQLNLNSSNASINSYTNTPINIYQNQISKTSDTDFVKKIEDRKIRNRESAQLSRQRKREEFDQLKNELSKARKTINLLRTENEKLRKRVAALEQESNRFFGPHTPQNQSNQTQFQYDDDEPPRSKKAAIFKTAGLCLFVVTALVAFSSPSYFENQNPPANLYLSQLKTKSQDVIASRNNRIARSLMTQRNFLNSDNSSFAVNGTDSGFDILVNGTNFDPECRFKAMNSSKSLRLKNELTDWVGRHDPLLSLILDSNLEYVGDAVRSLRRPPLLLQSGQAKPRQKSTFAFDLDNKPQSNVLKSDKSKMKSFENSMQVNKLTKNHHSSKMNTIRKHLNMVSRRQLRVAKGINNEYEKVYLPELMRELVSALQQKDDVLHVIALRDYFLLPPKSPYGANSTKKYSLPRISIVLPALSASDNSTFVRLLRIECEVFDTSLTHMRTRLINNLPAPNQSDNQHNI